MAVIRPFRGLRPRPDVAERIASPPYDVLDTDEGARFVGEVAVGLVPRRVFLLFDQGDLSDPPLVPPAGLELGPEPTGDDSSDEFLPQHIAGQA